MEWLLQPEAWVALATLTALEVVLGIDNIIFISILVSRLPARRRGRARFIGLGLAMLGRIGLLLSLSVIMRLTSPLFDLHGFAVSGRDFILIGGGLFLLAKSTFEIHGSLESAEGASRAQAASTFGAVLLQIALLDLVFSLDSVITAVGLARRLEVMIIAVVLAVGIMMASAGTISRFVEAHPTIKMLALSFLILIGFSLTAEGLHFHIPKGYIYFAMAFSIGVELLNLKVRRRQARPVALRKPVSKTGTLETGRS